MPVNVTVAFPILLVAYLLLVRNLRYRRLHALQREYTPEKLKSLTPAEAQRICHVAMDFETPTTMVLGTNIALFKVWAIPTVAELLLKTGELSPHNLSRRIADTSMLILEFVDNPLVGPGSGAESFDEGCYNALDPRSALAIARINWLHRKYPIRQDDYRFNLALFVLETIRSTTRFDWRSHSEIERHAFFVFWMEIGRRMGIEASWASLEEMEEWAEDYEKSYMVPNPASAKMVRLGIDYFASSIPNFPGKLKLFTTIVSYILDARTRRAMMLPEPPWLFVTIMDFMFNLRAFIVRHTFLPRTSPRPWTEKTASCVSNVSGTSPLPRIYCVEKLPGAPWYYPESTGLARLLNRLLTYFGIIDRKKLPGKQWKSQGYRFEELGPVRFENQGCEEVMKMAAEIQGAPVEGPWALNYEQKE